MSKSYIAVVGMLAAVLLVGCSPTTPPSQHKTFNPKLVMTMSAGVGSNDGTVILQNDGLQTAMNLTFTDAAGDRGVPKFLYVRLVRVGNQGAWITQSPSTPLDLPGGEGIMVSFPNGLDMPIKVTWTQVDINGVQSTVSQYVNN